MNKIGRQVDDIDKIYFTQLNLRTIRYVMADLGLSLDKTHTIMDKWGYTGSPCVAMALDDAIAQGKGPRAGEVVLFCASGGGITMATARMDRRIEKKAKGEAWMRALWTSPTARWNPTRSVNWCSNQQPAPPLMI
jgi:hypothetical protein